MRYEGKMNEEWWMLKDEGWRMMISSCWGVSVTDRQMNKQTNEHTDICECRVAFATEKSNENIPILQLSKAVKDFFFNLEVWILAFALKIRL